MPNLLIWRLLNHIAARSGIPSKSYIPYKSEYNSFQNYENNFLLFEIIAIEESMLSGGHSRKMST